MVTSPLPMPNKIVKAKAVANEAPPSIRMAKASGMKAIEIRPEVEGVEALAPDDLADAAGDLRHALDRRQCDGQRRGQPVRLQHRRQVHRHGAEHERRRRGGDGEQHHGNRP